MKKLTDTDRLNAIIDGLIFWRTKYRSGFGAHFAAKHGTGKGHYFSDCPREAIDCAIRGKPVKHCACCMNRRAPERKK